MEVTYHLDKNDYLRYNKFVINRVPALKRQAILRFLSVPAIILVESLVTHVQLTVTFIAVFLSALLWGSYVVWLQKQAVAAQTLGRIDMIGLHTLSLQPECLREQTSVLETRVEWHKITEIAESKQMIVLFLGPRWGFFVPKSIFPTPIAAQEFLETAQAYQQGIRDGVPPVLHSTSDIWPPPPQRII